MIAELTSQEALRRLTEEREGEKKKKTMEALCASNDGCDVANEGKLAPDRQMETHFKRH